MYSFFKREVSAWIIIRVKSLCQDQSGSTTADIYSFGNKSAPRGASNVLDVNSAPLSGHYHMLPAGTQMPDGLDIIADGIDVIPNSPHAWDIILFFRHEQ